MFLIMATLLFAAFALNVAMGSFGVSPVLGDVGEMLLLFAASLAFVAAVLKREAAAKEDNNQKTQGRNQDE